MLDTRTAQNPSLTFDELAQNFATPPKAYSPVPIWWWSGDTLTRERLRWQMERLTEGGVYNAVILNLAPTGPLYGSDPDDPPFLSEAWWTLFARVCEDAETLGFCLWFYDQLGFSGANLQAELVRNNPNFSGESLESLAADGTTLSLTCPSEGQPLAAFFTTEAGERVRVALSGRTAHITAKEAGRLRLVYSVRRGFDYFSPAACQALLDTVHGAFERRLGRFFGTTIAGSFQDELPNLASWSADFAEAFRQRKGYDLLGHLTALWEGTDEQAERVRADYQEMRAVLAEEAFFKPLFGWHERHGLVCGFDQQGPARAGQPLGTVQLYADYLRTHRWFGAPGSDHHGDSKIHSSLAHLYNRERVWIESFHSSGWGGTLEETFDWLLPWLGAGATLYDPHAVYYSTWGGWWEWAPPSTCWRQPYWRHYPVFAAAVGRLSYLLSQGRHVCDIGVLHPTTTVQANLTAEGQTLAPELTEAGSAYSKSFKRTATNRAQLANDVYEALVGSMMFLASEAGVLRRDRRDFDVLDDASVQRGKVTDGGLEVADEHFRVIVLPACSTLEAATAEQLIAFVEGGGALIAVAERPQHVLGSPETLARLTALFEQGQATLIPSADDLPQHLQGLERRVDAPVPVLHRRIGEHEVLFIPAVYPHASQSEDENASWLRADYSFDPARYARKIEVTVRGFEGTPELWDALSGERVPVAHTRDGDRTMLTVPFDRSPAALLVWSDTHNTAPMPEKTYETVLQTLPDTWHFSLEPTLDNRYGDFDKPDFAGAPPVQTWAFSHSTGEDTPEKTVQATFGCYGFWFGPGVKARLPEPTTSIVVPLAEGWQEAVYSLERGIYKDALHVPTLGPKGHVPEEFLAFGRVAAGEGVQFCTVLHLEHETTLQLALGAAAYKQVWLNGSELPEDAGGYLQLYPVTLRAGANLLEFRLVAQTDTELRAYYALVRDPEAFRRPERLTLSGSQQKDSRVVFSHTFEIPFLPLSLRVQVAADAACAVRLNGLELGRQGGFDPYYSLARVQPYSTEQVNQGANTLEVELQDTGRPFSVLIDGLVSAADGTTQSFISNESWHVKRDDGKAQPVTLVRQPLGDPAFALLWRRPPPLPGTLWLEGEPADETVLPLVPAVQAGRTAPERFRWTLPVGATQLHLAVAGKVRLWVNGEALSGDGPSFMLPNAEKSHRTALLEVVPERGRTGGSVFTGPITYDISGGTTRLGAWAEQGLETYSGGVRYRHTFVLDTLPDGLLILDLGRVRGTAEVQLNAQTAGVRILSPYRFDLTPLATVGENQLEVLVLNTLAPYLNAVSPTHYVRPGQDVSGLFGPISLLTYKEGPR